MLKVNDPFFWQKRIKKPHVFLFFHSISSLRDQVFDKRHCHRLQRTFPTEVSLQGGVRMEGLLQEVERIPV